VGKVLLEGDRKVASERAYEKGEKGDRTYRNKKGLYGTLWAGRKLQGKLLGFLGLSSAARTIEKGTNCCPTIWEGTARWQGKAFRQRRQGYPWSKNWGGDVAGLRRKRNPELFITATGVGKARGESGRGSSKEGEMSTKGVTWGNQ